VARKELDVNITTEGRDKGKTFHIVEMSAWDAERWAQRAFFAVMNSGVDIDENLAKAGMAGIAIAGLRAFGGIPYEKAQPLLDELLTCVKYRFGVGPADVRPLVMEDVEEPGTILQLRAEALNLHINFSPIVAPWHSPTTSSETTTAEPNLSNMSTSPLPPEPRFHRAKRATASLTR
jgi:hypothetical protein